MWGWGHWEYILSPVSAVRSTLERGHSIGTKLEHHQHKMLEQLDKAAMTEHSVSLVHHIQLQNTTSSPQHPHMDFIINEETVTELKQKYMNREDGFCTRMSSEPLNCFLIVHKNFPHWISRQVLMVPYTLHVPLSQGTNLSSPGTH
jgi:hypothetical protein